MSVGARVVDGSGGKYAAKVHPHGQLATGPYEFDDTSFKLMDVVDTAYNFFSPKVGKRLIITGIVFKANKLVSAVADATVVVYEATAADTTTVSKTLIQLAMTDGDIIVVTPTNIGVTEGRWVNGKTDDDDIAVTVMGHYIPVVK